MISGKMQGTENSKETKNDWRVKNAQWPKDW
jgi:hypothetical protein